MKSRFRRDDMKFQFLCDIYEEEVWTDEVTHCFVPVYGYYAENEKTMVRLFQKLADTVVRNWNKYFTTYQYELVRRIGIVLFLSFKYSIVLLAQFMDIIVFIVQTEACIHTRI